MSDDVFAGIEELVELVDGEPLETPAALADAFECWQCGGKGWYMYDHNHGQPCEVCCPHDQGRWLLGPNYRNAGKWSCRAGCGAFWNTETGD